MRTFRLFVAVLTSAIAAGLPVPVKGSPAAIKHWPSNGEVPADAPLRLQFNEPPVVGNHGRIVVCRAADRAEVASVDAAATEFSNEYGGRTLRYLPILVEGNTATIRLHTHALTSGEAYFVRVEPGVFKNAAGEEWTGISDEAGWRFQTRRAAENTGDRIIVAADGSGDFCTVQGAVDAVPTDLLKPVTVLVRRGTYEDCVRVPSGKDHIRLVGEDRRGVVLCGANNDQLNRGATLRALVGVEADDFTLENLTIRNTTPYKGTQAEALRVHAERCVVKHADFYSFQDTLQLNGRVYLEDCFVEGSVDFIWGAGSAFFERCALHAVHAGYCVQARNPPGMTGFIFDHCRLTGPADERPVWLARAEANRFPGSQVVFLNCQMDGHFQPEGWQVTGTRKGEMRFAEFGTTDLQGVPLDVTRRLAGSRQLTAPEAAALGTPATAIGGYAQWNPQKAEAPLAKVFDVKQAGAKGDGTTPDTEAIQKSLDAAGTAGGGIVRVPAGTYRTRPLFLRSHVTMHLDAGATLLGSEDAGDYGIADNAQKGKIVGLINGTDLVDVTMAGSGAIDGSGQHWWPAARAAKQANQPEPPRPRLVCFNGCHGVTVENVTLKNSPTFHLVPHDCEDVAIRNVTINAPADSPNTDGIDPSASRRVNISDCRIDTGDDNIAIKSGRVDPAHPGGACANLVITNCTFLHGHGMSIGSETLGGVSDVLVQNCTFENTRNGLRIKSPRGRGGPVQNVRFSDIQMTNVDPAVSVTCYYPSIPTEDTARPMAADTPIFRGIEIINLKATCPRDAGEIIGLPESPVTDFSMENVQITAKTGFVFRNVGSVRMSNVQILPATNEGQ